MDYIKTKITFLKIFFLFIICVESQELDKDITLEKKSLIILPSDLSNHKKISDQVLEDMGLPELSEKGERVTE